MLIGLTAAIISEYKRCRQHLRVWCPIYCTFQSLGVRHESFTTHAHTLLEIYHFSTLLCHGLHIARCAEKNYLAFTNVQTHTHCACCKKVSKVSSFDGTCWSLSHIKQKVVYFCYNKVLSEMLFLRLCFAFLPTLVLDRTWEEIKNTKHTGKEEINKRHLYRWNCSLQLTQ